MKNRFVLVCKEWEDREVPVYVKHIDTDKDSFNGYNITEDIEQAQRFTEKEAYKWSNEIYDSYCDEFEVMRYGEKV